MTLEPKKKREIILAASGAVIAVILIAIILFALNFVKNILETAEGKNGNTSPVARFNFEKLKSIGVIKE